MANMMIDLETLSLQPNAVVLSLGAVLFDEHQIIDKLYLRFNPEQQQNRHIEFECIQWWVKQSTCAQKVIIEQYDDYMPTTHLSHFLSWIRGNGIKLTDLNVWGNGSDFDCVILNNFLASYKYENLKFYNFRCFRTIKNILTLDDLEKPNRQGIHHNALDYAVYQTQYLQAICKKHGVKL